MVERPDRVPVRVGPEDLHGDREPVAGLGGVAPQPQRMPGGGLDPGRRPRLPAPQVVGPGPVCVPDGGIEVPGIDGGLSGTFPEPGGGLLAVRVLHRGQFRRAGVAGGGLGQSAGTFGTLGGPDPGGGCFSPDPFGVRVFRCGGQRVQVVPGDDVTDLLAVTGEGGPQMLGHGQVAGLAVPAGQRVVRDLAEHLLGELVVAAFGGQRVRGHGEHLAADQFGQRREVLAVSADPLSPERGSYQFAQQMLRQVAYDTLSRRDRKARHLAVAAHLRAAFAGDGEEVSEVIARHYLDALNAAPEDPDAGQIRADAIAARIRAAERAERTGALAQAATSYASAAELTPAQDAGGQQAAGRLWERAAQAASNVGDFGAAVGYADRARADYLQCGQARAAARAQAAAGEALRLWGHNAEARDQLTAAMAVLRADPDRDTVRALDHLATVAVFSGSDDADQLSAEALVLGQDLDVDAGLLGTLFLTRGIFLGTIGRRPQAIAYIRESARLVTQAGDNLKLGRTLNNLSHTLAATDPAAAAEAARTAADHLRRTGARDYLAIAVINLSQALLMLGDWDAVEAELARATDGDGLADHEIIIIPGAWLAALRGDPDRAEALLTRVPDLRASEEPQMQAHISTVEAFIAGARRPLESALHRARAALAYADAVGFVHEAMRWAWPLAVRTAWELEDAAATRQLHAMLDAHPSGRLPPMLRAERDLARARANGSDFAAAIAGLRELSTPYHLAHGLLDYAGELTRRGETEAAAAVAEEATAIAVQLRCQPLLDRAADATQSEAQITAAAGARPRTRATDTQP